MSDFFKIFRSQIDWEGRPLVLETGRVARQSTGSVWAGYGGTVVLCTVVAKKEAKPDMGFLPLSIHYQEKNFALGKIPGGFMKREGKPSEREVLLSRLIDRPLRPLFPKGFCNEVQVICTLLSYDYENDPDSLAIIGASAALSLSGVPFGGPVGAAKVGLKGDRFIINPTIAEMNESVLDLVVAGTKQGVLMVESKAQELSEKTMLTAVTLAHKSFQPVIDAIEELKAQAGKENWEFSRDFSEPLEKAIRKHALEPLEKAYKTSEKQTRSQAIGQIKENLLQALLEEEACVPSVDSQTLVQQLFEELKAEVLRDSLLKSKKRIDGRGLKDIRPIHCFPSILPRTHGSALFTRGETQALVVTTLGTGQDEQFIDDLGVEYKERFMLHYNFPPYSVGDVGRLSSPGRREIGHGKLAWRAIQPLIPAKDAFPYTIRVVSEVTESNGSSSMATVCGTSMALMDAGVPLPRAIAGIAMGLVKEENEFVVLSDILGDEDYLGDMDFKVAGTTQGITALQMDIKIESITAEIMEISLEQAKEGRLHILGEMEKAISASKISVSEQAPRLKNIKINPDKIRDIIGPGGKIIREICEKTGAKIDIDDEGNVTISGYNEESVNSAIQWINSITCEPEIGKTYEGKVVKIAEFGAFVNFLGGRDGLVHISELTNERVNKVSDILQVGQIVTVKVIGIERGKVKLSIKALLTNT